MKCFFCGKDDMDSAVLVPAWLPDGGLSAFACMSCARHKELYCEKHKSPHAGYDDKTTACLFCIEDMVNKEWPKFRQVAPQVREYLNPAYLEEAGEIVCNLTDGNEDLAILRFIASRARRKNISVDEMVKLVISGGRAGTVFGGYWLP